MLVNLLFWRKILFNNASRPPIIKTPYCREFANKIFIFLELCALISVVCGLFQKFYFKQLTCVNKKVRPAKPGRTYKAR